MTFSESYDPNNPFNNNPYPAGSYSGDPSYYPQYGAPLQNNTKAIISLVLGILSVFCCGLFTGIPAIILGKMARREIAQNPQTQQGDGLALAGFIIGIISTVLSVLALIFYTILFIIAINTGHPSYDPTT